jgi:hypothetical protein
MPGNVSAVTLSKVKPPTAGDGDENIHKKPLTALLRVERDLRRPPEHALHAKDT